MRTQTCSTCKTVKPIAGEWDVTVYMCAECVAAEKAEAVPAVSPEDAAVFEKIDTLRVHLASENAGRLFGTTQADRTRAAKNFDRLNVELDEVLSAMSPEQMRGYGEYRKATA